jgi:hypothetical protein
MTSPIVPATVASAIRRVSPMLRIIDLLQPEIALLDFSALHDYNGAMAWRDKFGDMTREVGTATRSALSVPSAARSRRKPSGKA